MLTASEALSQLLGSVHAIRDVETLSVSQANGRVLAETQYACVTVPDADNSAMDGYAFRYADVTDAATVLTVTQRIPAGATGMPLGRGEAARIFTGAPLPEGADTVVRQEWCLAEGGRLSFLHLPEKGEAVRRAGEQAKKGDPVLMAGTRLRSQHLGVAVAVGLTHLPVVRKPKVALLCTGDELVKPGEPLPPGKVYNSNCYMLRGLLEDFGCDVSDFGIVPDDFRTTCRYFVQAAAEHDLILTSGGASVGEEDHVKHAIETEGRLHFWKIAVKPGKPLVYGEIGRQASGGGTAIIGLPGNPVSGFVTFLLFVRPYLLAMQGIADVIPKALQLPCASAYPKADERNEFLRARINGNGEVELFGNQGSGILSSAVWGDGLVDNPPGHSIRPGEMVRFIPFSEFWRP